MNKVELSIVMPTFNKKEMVGEMIDSILANDYQDWELLVVDDGSELETLDYLRAYCERDSRIHLLNRDRQPKGAPTCRNIGMEHALGDLIIFFDSDDYIIPSCLRRRVEAAHQYHDMDFLVFPSGQYADGHFLGVTKENAYGYPVFSDDIAAFARKTLPFVVVNNIYKVSSLRKNHIRWDERLLSLQDSDFNMQCLMSDMKYRYVLSYPDYGYRIVGNNGSISKRVATQAHVESHLYAIDKFYRIIQAKYGNKYNTDLFIGILFIYNMVFESEERRNQVSRLLNVVRRYSSFCYLLFCFKVGLRRFLSCLVSEGMARKITMIDYLLWRRWNIRCLDAKRRQYVKSLNYHMYESVDEENS